MRSGSSTTSASRSSMQRASDSVDFRQAHPQLLRRRSRRRPAGVARRRGRQAAVALGAVIATTLTFAPTATVADSNAPPPNHVTMIADSVGGVLFWATGPREQLAQDIDLDLQVKTCRKLTVPGCPAYGDDAPESALETVRRLGSSLGRTVVVDVGYNDLYYTYAEGLDDVMAALVAAGVERVTWVTLEETYGMWKVINDVIRAAPRRWPQLTVADWAAVSAGKPWFVDGVHMNYEGAVAFAAFLRPYMLGACGPPCTAPRFCGLARSPQGFDPVSAVGEISCNEALAAVGAIKRGEPGEWGCSQVGTGPELDCWRGAVKVRVHDRAPVAPVRRGGVVTLANWSFRVWRDVLQGRRDERRWIALGRPPFCVPVAPREVLVALRLRPLRADGNCFVPRR